MNSTVTVQQKEITSLYAISRNMSIFVDYFEVFPDAKIDVIFHVMTTIIQVVASVLQESAVSIIYFQSRIK